MPNNLIIGSTSQLAHYFPSDYIRLDSEVSNIFEYLENQKFYSVYLCFADQRTYDQSLIEKDFINVNVNLTLKIIDKIKNISDRIIVYGTSELWNNYTGAITIKDKFDYKYSPYIKSKEILVEKIYNLRAKKLLSNVTILYPFNFNSIHRKPEFLFYKIFNSLIYKKKNQIGSINFKRDIVHAKYVAEQSIKANKDKLIGCGFLVDVEFFIDTLFKYYNRDYREFLKINHSIKSFHNEYWGYTTNFYLDLLKDTIEDLNEPMHRYGFSN